MVWRLWLLGTGVVAALVALTLAIHWAAPGAERQLDVATILRDLGVLFLGWTAFCGLYDLLTEE